jgi:uncharacterized protein YndB with AHSA1/START domain
MATKPLDRRAARSEVEIDADIERVWAALTDPIELVRWLPMEAEVRPEKSGVLLFRWGSDRCDPLGVTVWDPPRHLALVPAAAEGEPELLTSLWLRGRGARTHLRVETTGFPTDRDWDDLVFSSGLSYRFLMFQLRYYLERHAGQDRNVLALHKRVSCSREDAWKQLHDCNLLGLPVQRMLDVQEPWQMTATTSAPRGLMRIAVDPIRGEPEQQEVSLWLSAWGSGAHEIETVESIARKALSRQFQGIRKSPRAKREQRAIRPPDPFLAYIIPPSHAV